MVGKSSRTNSKNEVTWGENNRPLSFKGTRYEAFTFTTPDSYDEEDHFDKIYEQVFVPAIERAGYQAFRVDEDKISDSIINKIFDAVTTYPMALCDLSSRNPNVLYELGLRQAYNLPVVLVKDDVTDKIFDVSGISTVMYKSHRLVENVEKAISDISEALIQTKAGKVETLAKIIKVKSANYDSIEVKDNERIEILLNALANDVNELKHAQNRTQRAMVDKYETERVDNVRIDEITFGVLLKDGVTNKEIKRIMSRFVNVVKEWDREGNVLYVTVVGVTREDVFFIKNVLDSELSQ